MILIVDNANDGIVQGNCAPSLTDLGGRQGSIVTAIFDQFGSVDQEKSSQEFRLGESGWEPGHSPRHLSVLRSYSLSTINVDQL